MRLAIGIVLALLLTGCAWMHRAPERDVYGPCSHYDYNHDGVVGAPDYSLMLKQKPPPTPHEFAGFEHYFGQHCSS